MSVPPLGNILEWYQEGGSYGFCVKPICMLPIGIGTRLHQGEVEKSRLVHCVELVIADHEVADYFAYFDDLSTYIT